MDKKEKIHPLCDKCEQPVHPSNDVLSLLYCLTHDLSLITARARHLLPTDDCEGSPSRAQYIEGQPRDTRGYEYKEELESVTRDAYAEMQEDYKD